MICRFLTMSGSRLLIAAGAGIILLAGGCTNQHRPKLQFAGKLISQNATCPASQGTLVLQNDQVMFSPSDGTWTLSGTSQTDKIFLTRSRPGFDHKLYITTLSATRSADHVIGTYTTPSCNYAVDLKQF